MESVDRVLVARRAASVVWGATLGLLAARHHGRGRSLPEKPPAGRTVVGQRALGAMQLAAPPSSAAQNRYITSIVCRRWNIPNYREDNPSDKVRNSAEIPSVSQVWLVARRLYRATNVKEALGSSRLTLAPSQIYGGRGHPKAQKSSGLTFGSNFSGPWSPR